MIPTFCDAHFIKYQIPNIVETIAPDYIVYNEGLFPGGPESNTIMDDNFIKEYTLDGKRGFDFYELEEIIHTNQKKYPKVNIILNKMDYSNNTHTAPHCYTSACTNFSDLGIDLKEGDYIFPFEGDVFHHQDSKDEIAGYLKQLKPDTGFRSIWLDFIETQYYVEKKNLTPLHNGGEGGRQRRVCVRFGSEEFFINVVMNFMTQQYPMLNPTELITFHYPWWKPGKYKDLRYALLNRQPQYHMNWNKGLEQIKENMSEDRGDVVLRPDSPVEATNRYAGYINIEHPKQIREHSCYIKED